MDGMRGIVAQYTLAAAASVIGFLIAILVGILSWIFNRSLQETATELKALRESDTRLAAEIAAMRAELPEKYVGKADSAEFRKEMREAIQQMNATMQKGFESLSEKIYDIAKK